MSIVRVVQRTNIVPNPQVVGGTSGWTLNGGTGGAGGLSQVTSGGPVGGAGYFGRFTVTTAPTGGQATIRADGRTAGRLMPVVPGTAYTASIYGRYNKAVTGQILLQFFDGSSTQVGSTASAGVALAANTWGRLSVTATAPAGAVNAVVGFAMPSGTLPAVNDTIDATMAVLETGSTLGAFFDGSTANVGTPGNLGAVDYQWTNGATISPSTLGVWSYSLTVTPTVDMVNVPPRITLSIADADPAEASDTIIRNNPDGTTSIVRTADGNPQAISGGVAVLYDYEAPMGSGVSYYGMNSSGNVSPQVTVTANSAWLIHPGMPALSMPVALAPDTLVKRTYTAARGVFSVMGRRNVVVVTDGARKGENSQLVIWARSAAEKAAIDALVADNQALLLNVPTTLGYNETTKYISVADVEYNSPTGKVYDAWLAATLPFDEVDQPVGGSQSQRTYADVLAGNASYQAIPTKYSTYLAVLAGP